MERSLCVSQRLWQSMNGDQLEKEGRGVSRGAVTTSRGMTWVRAAREGAMGSIAGLEP